MSVTIIAEVAGAHGGSLKKALEYVDRFARCGADVVKFQAHPYSGARPTFTIGQWEELAWDCEDYDVEFLVTPFSLQAVDVLDRLVKRWKVASGHVTDHALLRRLKETGKPVLLSTGMSPTNEVDAALAVLTPSSVTLLECLSLYPTPPERVRVVRPYLSYTTVKSRRPWGLSDHSRHMAPSLLAVRNGASVIEVHVMLESGATGAPDQAVSFSPEDFSRLVSEIRFVEQMGWPVGLGGKDLTDPLIVAAREKYLVVTE